LKKEIPPFDGRSTGTNDLQGQACGVRDQMTLWSLHRVYCDARTIYKKECAICTRHLWGGYTVPLCIERLYVIIW